MPVRELDPVLGCARRTCSARSSRLLTIPSSPCCRVASKSIAPSSYAAGTCHEPSSPSPSNRSRRSLRGRAVRSSPSSRMQVEDHVASPGSARPAGRRSGRTRTCIRSWSTPKSGSPSSLRPMISPSTSRSRSPSGLVWISGQASEASLPLRVKSRARPPLPVDDVAEDPHAVPLHLVRPLGAGRDVGALGGEHRAHGVSVSGQGRQEPVARSAHLPSRPGSRPC